MAEPVLAAQCANSSDSPSQPEVSTVFLGPVGRVASWKLACAVGVVAGLLLALSAYKLCTRCVVPL